MKNQLIDQICYALAWYWVWANEMYRRSYWLYVAGQDWFWLHLLNDPDEHRK